MILIMISIQNLKKKNCIKNCSMLFSKTCIKAKNIIKITVEGHYLMFHARLRLMIVLTIST